MALTDRRRLFALELLADPKRNGAAAARAAGYVAESAKQEAHRLLQDPEVRAFIEERDAARLADLGVRHERVLAELVRIGMSSIRDFIDEAGAPRSADEVPADAWPAVASVTFTPDPVAEALTNGKKLLDDGYKRPAAEQARVIEKIRFHPKLPALALLAQHLGLVGADDAKGTASSDAIAKMSREDRVKRVAQLMEEAKLRVLEGGGGSGS